MPIDLLAFLGVSAVVIVTPGQDTALTIRNTLLGGHGAGIATAAGVAAGQAVWALATSLGIAALIVASEPLFLALRIAGAAYLIVLGTRTLIRAIQGSRDPEHAVIRATTAGRGAPFRQGLVSNLANPKMAVFFTSLLPQFAQPGETAGPLLLVLGLVFCALTLAWLWAYALAVGRAGDFIRRGPVRRILDAVMGAVFVVLGLRVATSPR
jgi:threonine/homoserine/homoserine lactone efflux protein